MFVLHILLNTNREPLLFSNPTQTHILHFQIRLQPIFRTFSAHAAFFDPAKWSDGPSRSANLKPVYISQNSEGYENSEDDQTGIFAIQSLTNNGPLRAQCGVFEHKSKNKIREKRQQ